MTTLETQFPPPLTRVQAAARRREENVLNEKYPGMHVAYLDHWEGDALVREVVAVAEPAGEFQDMLSALPREILDRVELTLVPEADSILIPSIWPV